LIAAHEHLCYPLFAERNNGLQGAPQQDADALMAALTQAMNVWGIAMQEVRLIAPDPVVEAADDLDELHYGKYSEVLWQGRWYLLLQS
jgi:hypothetical protein